MEVGDRGGADGYRGWQGARKERVGVWVELGGLAGVAAFGAWPTSRNQWFPSQSSCLRQVGVFLVGVKEVDHGIWLVSFMDYDLGYIDLEEKTLQPWRTPSGQKCNLCLRNVLLPMSPERT